MDAPCRSLFVVMTAALMLVSCDNREEALKNAMEKEVRKEASEAANERGKVHAERIAKQALEDIQKRDAAGEPKAAGVLYVSVVAPGRSVEEIETTVAQPLERAIGGLDGMVSVRARIQPGLCRMTVTLASGRDEVLARAEAIKVIRGAMAHLPPGIEQPILEQRDPDALPTLWIAARNGNNRTLGELSAVLSGEVRDSLLTIPGVGDVQLRGEVRRQSHIEVALEKLTPFNLPITDVAAAVAASNPAPGVDEVVELANLVIAQVNGTPIRLRDVASVVNGAERVGFARYQGKPTVLMGVYIATDAEAPKVAAAVRERLSGIQLPFDLKLDIIGDATRGDAEDLLIELQSPDGTTLEAAEKTTAAFAAAIRDRLPASEVGDLLTLGPDRDGDPGRTYLLLSSPARRSATTENILQRVRKTAIDFPGTRVRVNVRRGMLPGEVEFPVEIRVSGDDMEQLARWGTEILRRAGEEPEFVDLSAADIRTTQEQHVVPDLARVAEAGIAAREMSDVVSTAVKGRLFPHRGGAIRLSMGKHSFADIGKLLIRAKDGKLVPLESLARIETVRSPAALERVNGRRCLTIAATAQSPATGEAAKAKLRDIANESRDKLRLPDAYQVIDE